MGGVAMVGCPKSLDEDLVPPLTAMQAMVEAERCLYCYDAPCIRACPTSIDIPGFIRRISTGNARGAGVKILEANIMGGTCARVCPTEVLCEEACVRTTSEGVPVAIGRLQRFATDVVFAAGRHPFARAERTGRRIAVVGAGPAGLSCAHRLAMHGHDVTILEAKPKSGGLNEYGIAAYKMVDAFAAREVAFILDIGGIDIRHDTAMGRDVTLHELRQRYDAVFIGLGLAGTNRLGIPGEQLNGVADAIAVIAALRQAEERTDVMAGRRVVVIGGGNTAIDAAVQSKLTGAAEVTLAYRRGADQMGATGFEQSLAKVADVTVRTWLAPLEIEGVGGVVTGIRFARTRVEGGRLINMDETVSLACDVVLKAVGQALDPDGLDGLVVDRGRIVVDEAHRTSLAGVFAGGDCVKSGQDLTVQAVEDGKRAAASIHAMLTAS